MNNRVRSLLFTLSLAAMLGMGSTAAAAQKSRHAPADKFFIISSVNIPRRQLVLKLPSEVTMQMAVNDKTEIVGENGKKIGLKDLRSGDTAFITYTGGSEKPMAVKIRLGPMTVQELHKRYLNSLPPSGLAAPPLVAPKAAKNVQRS